MKVQYFFILSAAVLLLFACKKDEPADLDTEEVTQTANEQSVSFNQRIPTIDDDFKVKIYELQERIKIDPENVELRKQFCQTAYSAEKMVMITTGIGRLTNPETGQAITRSMVERSAKVDATRWALYATNWLMYDYQPAFKEIKGNFNRNTQVIDKIVVGDSLFLYLASDLSQ